MQQKVTIDDAIEKGERFVNYPSYIILSIGVFLIIYLGNLFNYTLWFYIVGFIVILAISCFYWSLNIAKWRIWAFSEVRNVHELKKRAIQQHIIGVENGVFEKLEIRNKNQQEQWQKLQTKFKRKDEFIDDLAIPSETIINFSKSIHYNKMTIYLLYAIVGVFVVMDGRFYIPGLGVISLFLYLAFSEYKQSTKCLIPIIISEKGLLIGHTKHYNWSEITNDVAQVDIYSVLTTRYLVFTHLDLFIKIDITNLDISIDQLNSLLVFYRGRFEKQNNN